MGSRHSDTFVNGRLASLKASNLYRTLKSVVVKGPVAVVDGKDVIHMCSNDYLGLSQNRRVVRTAISALKHLSQASSRLIAGNDPAMENLEEKLAVHRRTEAALVYPTGYMANLGTISALADKKTTILSDELNHASIIDACKLSGANVRVFGHNDVGNFEELAREPGRKIVVTEGIFSMDGDTACLREICQIAQKHEVMTVVDDAHGDFIVGPKFSGVPASLGVDIDVHVSSLSKGLGCFGGYIAASTKIRDLLVNTSRQFIYSSALPDHVCVAAMTGIPIAKNGHLQKRLQANIKFFSSRLARQGFALSNSSSHIIPVMVGEEKKAIMFSQELLKCGVYAQAIRYPTVKKGSARLRVSITSMHTRKHLEYAVDAFSIAGKKSGII